MSQISSKCKKIFHKIPWMWIGFLIVSVVWIPYFVLGSGCYIQMNDQLDGEVLNYIYRAKYLFSGQGMIPEFMNGMQASAMTPPAPVGVLFYKVFSPFAAFAAMHIFVLMTGYIGMYLLSKKITGSSFAAMIIGGIFAYLPFYPVYGLSILGQPLLIWALWRIYETDGRKPVYYLWIFLYGVSSSLALVGFAWVALLLVVWIVIGWRTHKPVAKGLGTAFLLLLGTYVLCNLELVGGMLGIGQSFVAHREEMIIAVISNWKSYFWEIFAEGGSYGKSYNAVIIVLAVLLLAGYPFVLRKLSGEHGKNCKKAYGMLAGLFGFAVLISVAAVLWRVQWVADIRTQIGGVAKYFQADRIYWLLPVCWYVILAICIRLILGEEKKFFWIRQGVVAGLGILLCLMVYPNSTVYHNLRLMIFPDTYHLMDWEDYYAEDVFEQIEEFIGEEKSSYRTVSLGITPAAALYNGFYCLDGYSNLYPLEYKHEFREIIAKELEKSEELRVYFDAWGNRCYLFNGETGNYMMIAGNNGGSFVSLDLNTAKMYEMGARYLFAAMPIENAEEIGLTLLREEPFETESSYYRIWLYGVNH